ncbi:MULTISPECIES: dienelactone hydrolase family protein [unclassified Flavobacterium]|uniref:dienelactone hydrolase family protein n=1 Tax=unclassified Flavobacterium TaxID=196869 RepID=UPI003F93F3E6
MKMTEIDIPLSNVTLKGNLVVDDDTIGIVIFSHGSGSSRFSPRNNYVANLFQKHHIGTLLFDLLTEQEDEIYENRFNIDLLVSRLIEVTEWLSKNNLTKKYPLAYFGASTGAASALRAAAYFGDQIKAVVSRGGRPDLALSSLHLVKSPTLLIVGQLDFPVVLMNKEAYDELQTTKEMKIIPGATHLFEESGKLTEVAEIAVEWYIKYFSAPI